MLPHSMRVRGDAGWGKALPSRAPTGGRNDGGTHVCRQQRVGSVFRLDELQDQKGLMARQARPEPSCLGSWGEVNRTIAHDGGACSLPATHRESHSTS